MKEDREELNKMLSESADGVVNFNNTPACISDFAYDVREIAENADETRVYTPENTDEWDWQCMCNQLDLAEAKDVRRIFRCDKNGIETMILAFEDDYTL